MQLSKDRVGGVDGRSSFCCEDQVIPATGTEREDCTREKTSLVAVIHTVTSVHRLATQSLQIEAESWSRASSRTGKTDGESSSKV